MPTPTLQVQVRGIVPTPTGCGVSGRGQQGHCHLRGSQRGRRHHHGPAWDEEVAPADPRPDPQHPGWLGARVEGGHQRLSNT